MDDIPTYRDFEAQTGQNLTLSPVAVEERGSGVSGNLPPDSQINQWVNTIGVRRH